MMERNNWANLPNEISELVLNRLCEISITSFKSVCKKWYSASQESSNLSLLKPVPSPPWLTIPFSCSDHHRQISSCCYYNVTNKKIHHSGTNHPWRAPCKAEAVCVGSGHGWLAFIDFRCVIYLVNPFTLATIQLPPIETLPDILSSSLSPNGDGSVDFEYWNKFEGGSVEKRSSRDIFKGNMFSLDMIYEYLVKLVMSSDPSSIEETTIMIIYGDLQQLAFCRLGDNSWTALGLDGHITAKDDIFYSDTTRQFHAWSDVFWTLETWDLSDFSSPKRSCIDYPAVRGPLIEAAETLWRRGIIPKMHLAELYGDLLVVCRFEGVDGNDKTFYFTVYKLDREKEEWINIKTLGDNGEGVLFLGISNAITFSAFDFLGLQRNSIYFTTDDDFSVFNLGDNSIDSLYHHGDFQETFSPSVWISPNPW